MRHSFAFPIVALAGLLAGCVSAPSGPGVTALPGTGKSYEQFNRDEAMCRGYAQNNLGAGAQTAANSATGTAVAGTAVGAGGGLLVGSAMANNSAWRSSDDLQDRYDTVYTQCMYAKGNKVPVAYGYGEATSSPVPPDYYPAAPAEGVPPDYVPR